MRKIETLKQVQALIGETYMYAAIIAIVALVLAFIIANVIKYEGGKNATDHIKRRVWYIIVGIITPIAFFLYNVFYVSTFISKAPLKAQFSTANTLATLEVLGIYLVVGILTMLLMRSSKWGSILGKSKK
jgi:beta-lactamase regulating signal transducer with metallopeptidase domain